MKRGTPGEGSPRKNSHTGLFLLPSCAFKCKRVSHSAECDKGLCPFETHELLKKLDQNFYIYLSRQILIYQKKERLPWAFFLIQ
jgi:hypothetical protein